MSRHNPFGVVGRAAEGDVSNTPTPSVPSRIKRTSAANFSTNKRSRVAKAKRRASQRKKRRRGLKSGGR